MSRKRHEGVLLVPCSEHDEIHVIPAPVEHDEDEPCPVHICDKEVYCDPSYDEESTSTTVGYNPKYAANYDKLDWN